MAKYKYEDKATERAIDKLRSQGMTDETIEKSGIYKFKKDDEVVPSQTLKKGNSFQKAKRIMSRAMGKWRSIKKPTILTQPHKYTYPTEME
jgi:hypothetical protein